MTTRELFISSVVVGHETLFISASTAIKKSANRGTLTIRKLNQSPYTITPSGIPIFQPSISVETTSITRARQAIKKVMMIIASIVV